jgi:small conductance mechanosensitive channel
MNEKGLAVNKSTLPCADCEDIRYTPAVADDRGRWQKDPSRAAILLYGGRERLRQFEMERAYLQKEKGKQQMIRRNRMQKTVKPSFFLTALMMTLMILWMAPAWADGEKPKPATTANPDVPVKELELLIRPLTKDDLKVEAEGWLILLKEHASRVSQNKIDAMKAEGDAKAKLLADATLLQEQQTARIDRMQAVVEEFRKKGGEVDAYDKYLKTVSGIKVDATDAQGSFNLVTGWLTSAEGGLRWAKNLLMFILTLVAFKVLSAILGTAIRKAVSKITGASELLKDFIVNSVRKVALAVGLVIALSMLEVNIGPFLAAIGATGFILGFALQGTLSNFAAGLMILLYRPYDIGDSVTVAGTSGKVSAMSLVSTTLRTENQVITIPNSSIWGGIITNESAAKPSGSIDGMKQQGMP